MRDKALFTFKLLTVLCLMVAIACLALEAYAMPFTTRIVQARGGLRVREEPSLESKHIYTLDDCETVIIYAEENGWYLIGANNGDHHPFGWACADYLK